MFFAKSGPFKSRFGALVMQRILLSKIQTSFANKTFSNCGWKALKENSCLETILLKKCALTRRSRKNVTSSLSSFSVENQLWKLLFTAVLMAKAQQFASETKICAKWPPSRLWIPKYFVRLLELCKAIFFNGHNVLFCLRLWSFQFPHPKLLEFQNQTFFCGWILKSRSLNNSFWKEWNYLDFLNVECSQQRHLRDKDVMHHIPFPSSRSSGTKSLEGGHKIIQTESLNSQFCGISTRKGVMQK